MITNMVQLMPLPPIISCFIKIRHDFTFWCQLTQVVLEYRLLNGYLFVCILTSQCQWPILVAFPCTHICLTTEGRLLGKSGYNFSSGSLFIGPWTGGDSRCGDLNITVTST